MIDLAPSHKRGLTLANPLMNAAGVLGFAGEYRGLIDLAGLGAFVTNPITFAPRAPARGPNAVPLEAGVLIHNGLPNPGAGGSLRRYGREWSRLGCPVIVHLAATTPDEVRRAVERLERADGVGGLELGLREDALPDECARLIRAARGGPPLIVRLPLARAVELAGLAAQAGADALTAGAPPRSSADFNGETITGRYYGAEVFPQALEAVRNVVGAIDRSPLPIIGAGGIFSAEHARAMLAAGALAVQMDAALWRRPQLVNEIATALAA